MRSDAGPGHRCGKVLKKRLTMLQIKTLSQLKGHDVFELAYAHSYPARHWSEDSIYLSDDDMGIVPLIPYLNAVFPSFAYYGPQQVTLDQWQQVLQAYQADPNRDLTLVSFFEAVRQWLRNGNCNAEYFWILGI